MQSICSKLLCVSSLMIIYGISSNEVVSYSWHQPRHTNASLGASVEKQIPYKTLYFEEQLDHFDFSNTKTFKLRYFLVDQHWDKDGGPIFFYTGNELSIEWFYNNTGFMLDIAPEFKAMLVFAEHRYYGKTQPFGPLAHKNVANLRWLTSEQALADYAELIRHIKETVAGAEKSPVVAIGGSYGGQLAAWFRMKYPNVVVGALASSAPIWSFPGLNPCNTTTVTTSALWEKTSKTCVKNIHQSYKTMDTMASQDGGLEFLSKTFGMCTPLKSASDYFLFKALLAYTYFQYAEMNYPYPAHSLQPLPALPVTAACGFLSKPLQGKELLVGVSKVVNLFYNYTGGLQCFDMINPAFIGGSLDLSMYLYQYCTELIFPTCSKDKGVFFEMPWNLDLVSNVCYRVYNVKPRPDWGMLQFWGKDLKAASNIIFSNGDLDPWHGLGVLESVSDSVVAIRIKDGAHIFDIQGNHVLDPPSVRKAREQEKNIFRKWLQHYYRENQQKYTF